MVIFDSKYNILLIENQYFPCVTYINTLFQASNVEIEQYENYQKMSFRNRCEVAGSNGVVNLSVPLEQGRNQRQLMKDVRISYQTDWQTQQLRTLESCYSRSPFFEFYRDQVETLIRKKEDFLLDKNLAILEWLQQKLKFPSKISLTQTFQKDLFQNVLDLRNRFLPKYARTEKMGFVYTQVFEDRIGFQNNLSVLDLLFCAGPDTQRLLSGNIKSN
jgi:hypothetical protein